MFPFINLRYTTTTTTSVCTGVIYWAHMEQKTARKQTFELGGQTLTRGEAFLGALIGRIFLLLLLFPNPPFHLYLFLSL